MPTWLEQFYNIVSRPIEVARDEYHVDPLIFGLLYFFSFIPFYYGVFEIARGLIKKSAVQVAKGVAINRFAWALPYIYVIAFGRNLPWWVYVGVFGWLLFGLMALRSRKQQERLVKQAGNVSGKLANLLLKIIPPKIRLVQPPELDKALQVEYRVFRSLGYCERSDVGRIEEYADYNSGSRFYAAYWCGRMIGVLRLIGGGDKAPPFMSEPFALDDDYAALLAAKNVEEVGVVAVVPFFVNAEVGKLLYKAAWTDAKMRGIDCWGVLVEEFLWKIFNHRYHFTFQQAGLPRDYMGGFVYPLVMSFEDVERHMSRQDPALYAWFTSEVPRERLAAPPALLQ